MTASVQPVAIVTGGARGIGLAIARWFLAHDYRVALWDINDATLARTVADLDDRARVLGLVCDVSTPHDVKAAAAETWSRFGRVDVLVNNAGVAVFKPIGETTFEEWTHVLGTNLNGPFLCTQAVAPLMQRTGGEWDVTEPIQVLERRIAPEKFEPATGEGQQPAIPVRVGPRLLRVVHGDGLAEQVDRGDAHRADDRGGERHRLAPEAAGDRVRQRAPSSR